MAISISGTPRKFDSAELERRQQGYHAAYKQTDQCHEVVRGSIPLEILTNVISHHEQGYKLTSKYPAAFDQMSYTVRMEKPEHLQLLDLEAINERVKQEYIVELQEELTKYRALLTRQLLEKAERAEQQKLEAKRAKLLAEVAAEVNGVFSEQLVVPE